MISKKTFLYATAVLLTVREYVLLFGSVQLRKLTSRSTIFEGDNALYSARLNGPPPNNRFSLDFKNLDDFTRLAMK